MTCPGFFYQSYLEEAPASYLVMLPSRGHAALAGAAPTEEGKQYSTLLTRQIAEAVTLANAALQPARMSAAIGREESLVFNRRFLMKDGSVRFNPGLLNPGIVRPVGPVDPDVGVVYFEWPSGQPLATYVNYALHLDTTGGDLVSADYPYTLSKLLREAKGPGMPTLFTIGTSGNINHLDVTRPAPQKGYAEAARIGAVLAGEVLRTYKKLQAVPAAAPRGVRETVQFPLPEVGPGDAAFTRRRGFGRTSDRHGNRVAAAPGSRERRDRLGVVFPEF